MSRDANDRPLCSRCSSRDRRAEVREQEEQYWRESLLKRQSVLAQELETHWGRELFGEFVDHEVGRTSAKELARNLKRTVRVFKTMEQGFPGKGAINAASLMERYTPEEMRRGQSVFAFLHAAGVEVPTRVELENLAEKRRVMNLLRRADRSAHASVLRRFAARLEQPNRRGVVPILKTRSLSLRAACGLAQVAGDATLSQRAVDAYLKKTPGQRAALAAFVSFLKLEGIEVSLPGKRRTKRLHAATASEGTEGLSCCLDVLRTAEDFVPLRAAVAGTLVGLLGLSLREVVQYPRSSLKIGSQGHMGLETDGSKIALDSRIETGFLKYLVLRDSMLGGAGGYLLPGRPLYQHVSEKTISMRLNTFGVSVKALSMSARDWLKQETVLDQE